MRRLACAILAVATALQAQDAWGTWLARLRERTGPDLAWVLVLRPADGRGAWWQQDDLCRRLAATKEFQVQVLPEAAARDLTLVKEWKSEPRWLLLAPDGERQAEGRGRPTGTLLVAELKALGFTPRWERREAFLKEHPGHGPARLEAVLEAQTVAAARLASVPGGNAAFLAKLAVLPRDPAAVAQRDAMYQEVGEALVELSRVPLWWEQERLALRRLGPRPEAGLPAPLEAAFLRLRDQTRQDLERNPADEALLDTWTTLALMTGERVQDLVATVVPAPGQAWPPDGLVTVLAEGHAAAGDWEGMLRSLDALKGVATRQPADAGQWDDARYAQALLEVQRARALARLERWEEAAGAVGEARFLAGQRWRGFLPFLLRRSIPQAFTDRKEVFAPFLDGEPLPDPPLPPGPPRLRLLALGAPGWVKAWADLPASPELAEWGPTELRFETASREQEAALRERHGWTGPRWALLAGTDLRASGEVVPTPRELAQRLAAQGPSRLQRLDRFLERHPDHRPARALRLELLRSRMPDRRLEPRLAEDARVLRSRIQAGEGWIPDPALWQWAALEVLPALESDLERWPDRAPTWRAWLDWARLHPRQPSALLLAQRLPLWGGEAGWASRLPAGVHRAVAEELRPAGRFEEMRRWFQGAWEGLDRQNRRRGPAPNWVRAQRRNQKEAIVDPLREALLALRRDAEVVALDREVAVWLGEEGR